MGFGLLLPLRAVQAVFAVVILGLSGYGKKMRSMRFIVDFDTNEYTVAHWYDADTLTASPSQINFLIFTPLFTLLSIAYLEITPRWAKRGEKASLLRALQIRKVPF
jgi:hypothetical protein